MKYLKRSIIPLILITCYLAGIAVLAFFSQRASNDSFFVFDFDASFAILIFLTAPTFLMIISFLFWLGRYITYRQCNLEKQEIIISSVVWGTLFLIGLFSFFFLTLGMF